MFDSLEDQIKLDEHIEVSRKERIVKILAIIALSILLFGGLYFAIRMIG
jgi:predicted membrane protein